MKTKKNSERTKVKKKQGQKKPRKETKERIAFLVTVLSLVALRLGGGGAPHLATSMNGDSYNSKYPFLWVRLVTTFPRSLFLSAIRSVHSAAATLDLG